MFSARSLCNLDGLEQALNQVAEKCAAQSAALTRLECEHARKASLTQVSEFEETLRSRLEVIGREVERIQRKVQLVKGKDGEDVDRDAGNIGSVVSWQCDKVRALYREVGEKAAARDLEAVREQTIKAVNGLEQKVCMERASVKEVDRIQNMQQNMLQQLSVVQQLLGNKLDRVEFTFLEDMVDRIQTFSEYHDDIKQRLEESEQKVNVLEAEKSEALSRIEHFELELVELRESVGKSASSSDVEQLAALVVAMQEQIQTLAHQQQVDLISEKLNNTHKQVQTLANALDVKLKQDERIQKKNQVLLSGKANAETLKDKASLKYCEEMFAKILGQIQQKADASTATKLLERTATTETHQEDLERKTNLALRFIEWFSSRGEAFEHNFNLVEQNLNKLTAKTLDPVSASSRAPYSNATRLNSLAESIASIRRSELSSSTR